MKLKLNTDLKGVITPPVSLSFPKELQVPMQGTSSLDAQKRWGWAQSHSPTGERRMSVLQRLGPGLVPADLLRGFAPEPLGVGHRGREVGLVLAAARGQRPAAPAPESAPRAGGHVRPAGRAGSARGRGRGQGPAEAPRAGDFATLQPRRLHSCRRGRPFLPNSLQAPPRAAWNAPPVGRSRLPGAPRRAGGGREKTPRCAQGPGTLEGTTRVAGKNRPGAAGGSWRGGAESGRGVGSWRETRRVRSPATPPGGAPPPRHWRAPKARTAGPAPAVFQQTSSVQLLGVGLREPAGRAASPRGGGSRRPSRTLRPSGP